VEDLRRLLDHLSIEQAYIGGLSMGGSVALNFGLTYPAMARAIIVASAGSGSDDPEQFREEGDRLAVRLLREGMAPVANDYARGPARVQFQRKDPQGWRKFHQGLAAHLALGSALTYRGVQMKRPPIYDLEDRLKQMPVPTLVLIGDEDDACVSPAIFMKRVIPRCGLAVFPKSGHTINLEEPAWFNQTVLEFLIEVENGGWGERAAVAP
jgi:pimeloyl-ACP methyl ester carboxylesterase